MPELYLLRPWWLATLPPLLGVLWWLWRSRGDGLRWRGVCDPHLLEALLVPRNDDGGRRWLVAAIVAIALIVLALAGPAVDQGELPLMRGGSGRVVVLDLSPSMYAVDLIPSRVHRARQSVAESLHRSRADRLGLVVFAGDAFVVAPMTRDLHTLTHLLSALEPGLLPRAGARPDLGLKAAGDLLEASGVGRGEVLYVGDSAGDDRTLEAARDLQERGFALSVLAVGTPAGGPIRQPSGALVTDRDGQVVVAALSLSDLSRIARAGGGKFAHLGLDAGAPSALLVGAGSPDVDRSDSTHGAGRARDHGPWLLLALLPLAAMAFRRGWLLGLLLCLQPLAPRHAHAQDGSLEWEALWLRPEQRVARELEQDAPARAWSLARELTTHPRWRAAAALRAGELDTAIRIYSGLQGADDYYNLGNALAARGRLQAALRAYEQALRLTPGEPDALHNRELVSRLLRAMRAGEGASGSRSDAGSGEPPRGGREPRPGSGAGTGRSIGAGRGTTDPASGVRREDGGTAATGTRAPRADGDPGELDEGQRQQLEKLLVRLPTSPAELLRHRFAMELARREERESDTGPAW